MRDPYCRDVFSSFQEQLPPALLETMNNDPRTFRLVYDQMRAMLGQGPYFASLGGPPDPQCPRANNLCCANAYTGSGTTATTGAEANSDSYSEIREH